MQARERKDSDEKGLDIRASAHALGLHPAVSLLTRDVSDSDCGDRLPSPASGLAQLLLQISQTNDDRLDRRAKKPASQKKGAFASPLIGNQSPMFGATLVIAPRPLKQARVEVETSTAPSAFESSAGFAILFPRRVSQRLQARHSISINGREGS
jgi:hypothetical protein